MDKSKYLFGYRLARLHNRERLNFQLGMLLVHVPTHLEPGIIELYLLLRKGPGYFTLFGSRGGGGHFEVKEGHPIFTNNMIFIECGVIALFEAFYMLRDHNHVKMKF